MRVMKSITIIAALSLAGCSMPTDVTYYTLCRKPPLSSGAACIASFDADEPDDYNKQNCEIFRELVQNQPLVTVTWFCQVK